MIADDADVARVQLVEERVRVEKVEVQTDHVRVHTVTDERTELVKQVLRTGQLDVTRLPFDQEVTDPPLPRHEGDTLVVSLVEERLVKRLFLVEEVHVTRSSQAETVDIPVSLRRMRAIVEQDGANQQSTGRE
jgi:stress response protein YsnF